MGAAMIDGDDLGAALMASPRVFSFVIGIAGAASRTVVSPLERLKIILYASTRLLAQLSPLLNCLVGCAVGISSQVQTTRVSSYQGVFPSLLKIGREEGWKGYFRGNGVNVIRIGRRLSSCLL